MQYSVRNVRRFHGPVGSQERRDAAGVIRHRLDRARISDEARPAELAHETRCVRECLSGPADIGVFPAAGSAHSADAPARIVVRAEPPIIATAHRACRSLSCHPLLAASLTCVAEARGPVCHSLPPQRSDEALARRSTSWRLRNSTQR